MTILLFGANGQVGWELQRALLPFGNLISCGRSEVNFEDLVSLRQFIRHHKPNIIVNAAAYTAVDKAESNPQLARCINAEAVEVLATEAKASNAWLIHYSTDYVFDGKKSDAYYELDATEPLNIYGQTKLEGERLVQASGCNHLIFRTSWVYAARGSNFFRTMLRLAQEQEQIKVVADQIGAPTSAEMIADVTALAIEQINNTQNSNHHFNGLYHLTASGQTSWHGFATEIIDTTRLLALPIKTAQKNIIPITTIEYPLPARRPANSLLNTTKLYDIFGVRLPPWQHHMKRALSKYMQQGTV